MPTPRFYVVCDNPQCAWHQVVREAWFVRVGQDMFSKPAVYCGCNTAVEMRVVEPLDLSAGLDQLPPRDPDDADALLPLTAFGGPV